MRFFFSILIGFASLVVLVAQKQAIATYNFDGCTLNEQYNFTDAGLTRNPITCGCGLENESMVFNGSQSLEYPSSINQIFFDDFTIDFYVSIVAGDKPVDILSVKSSCTLDSSIYLRYLPQTSELLLEISQNSGTYNGLRGVFKKNCWTRITIVRQALNYLLYVDNRLLDIAQPSTEIIPGKNARLRFAGSPCPNDDKLVGNLEDLNIYNVAVTPSDLNSTYYFPNTIITKDTTVTQGSTVEIEVGASCFDSFVWSPTSTLSGINTIESVVARPDVTTTYQLLVNANACTDTSAVTVYVIAPEDKKCDELFFPTAFTPNGDNLNDDIGISNQFIITEIKHYEILDRWGGQIARYNDKTDRWDGIIGGKEAVTGSYMYNIRYVCDNKEYRASGAFMLIR
ncbi:MAG TPA: T9SS type B sorting domain-containing protein [Saprospiraceae bacterium]|nr:T9SS type B sorting domain-containing protein [Saprospiraceae bacterium]